MTLLITAIVNLVVGWLIGCSGIAGFLLPIFYTNFLHFSVADALTTSFTSFAAAGVIGSINYYRKGNLPVESSITLGIGSMLGAIFGVAANSLIPDVVVILILNMVVVASGISILWRDRKHAKPTNVDHLSGNRLLARRSFSIALGFVVGLICALSGAGGPILLIPILVVLGLEVHCAIGIALFDSVFIALPSIIGYGLRSDFHANGQTMAIGCAVLIVGVFVGSRTAHRINQRLLEKGIGLFSIVIAVCLILRTWILRGL